MKKLVTFLLLLLAPLARGQQTMISATVKDPATNPYAFGTGSASLVCPGNQQPTYHGFTVPRVTPITGFDGTGKFIETLYDVSLLDQVGCGYTFAITAQDGKTSFTTGLITTVTGHAPPAGPALDLSATISAFAVTLPLTSLAQFLTLNNTWTGSNIFSLLTTFSAGITGTGSIGTLTVPGASLPATVVQTNQANTYTTGLQDFTAGTMEIPEAAGFTANANSTIGLDTTANLTHLWSGGADSLAAATTSTSTTTTFPLFATATAGIYSPRAMAVGDLPTSGTWPFAGNYINTGKVVIKQLDVCAFSVDAANTMGWAGAEGGAWINAADAALTTACGTNIPGTIFVYGVVVATTQITVGVRHTLDINGAVTVANPILMSDGANIDCHHSRGSGGASTVNACIVATAGMAQVIRGLTQDGLTEMFTVQRFAIDGGFQTFTTGIIDTTGMNDRTLIENGEIIHWNGAVPALYTSNAASNSTSFQTFRNIWINAQGTGGQTTQTCISIVISGSGQNGSIIEMNYDHVECTGTSNPTRMVLVQNTSSTATANAISNIHFTDLSFQIGNAGPTTSGVYVDKAWNVTLEHTVCLNGAITNCIDVSSNVNNVGEYAHNTEWGLGGSVTNLINDGLNSITLPVTGGHVAVENYLFFNSASANASNFYDHAIQIGGSTVPAVNGSGNFQANASSGLIPVITSSGAAVLGDTSTTLGSGSGKAYGVVGVAKANADAAGDRAYGGWFKATATNSTASEVGVHAETADTTGTAAEFGNAGSVKFSIAGNGSHNYVESTAPSGVASSDICYGDSTAHALKCSYNNGSFNILPTVTAADTTTTHVLHATATANIYTASAIVAGDLPTSGIPNVVYNNTTNTATAAMTLDLSASTVANAFKIPVGAGLTAGANGVEAYDSTNNNTHIRTNAADSLAVAEAAALAANVIPKATNATNSLVTASSCTDNGTVFSCTEGFSPPQAAGIIGTTTNNNANAGSVGEYVTATVATGSSVSLSTGATSNVTSISLTAGDWDVWGTVDYTAGATTSITNQRQGISTTTGTLGAQDTFSSNSTAAQVPTAAIDDAFPTPNVRLSLASTTTVFLVSNATFTLSTLKAYGTISARRRR